MYVLFVQLFFSVVDLCSIMMHLISLVKFY